MEIDIEIKKGRLTIVLISLVLLAGSIGVIAQSGDPLAAIGHSAYELWVNFGGGPTQAMRLDSALEKLNHRNIRCVHIEEHNPGTADNKVECPPSGPPYYYATGGYCYSVIGGEKQNCEKDYGERAGWYYPATGSYNIVTGYNSPINPRTYLSAGWVGDNSWSDDTIGVICCTSEIYE